MALQGLDRAVAPPPATARKMLETIGGRWWNVYIGGPESGGHGWTPQLVGQYVDQGIKRFMLTYVGRQSSGPLTRAQGQVDGREALALARSFGYSGAFPLCLDVELPTFEGAPGPTVEYTRAWCATVRDGGARPGVYANPAPLQAMGKGKVDADFVWVASWVSQTAAKRDPHAIPRMPDGLWGKPGMRAWQYAGAFNGKACEVLGLNVDINVADAGCLAGPPGRRHGRLPGGAAGPLRRGSRGKRVERLTRRLTYLRSRSGDPYLEGPHKRFDAATEAAVKDFQREHRLEVDGVYGSESAQALLRAIQHQRGRKRGPKRAPEKRRPATLRALVEDVRRCDAATDRAWERLAEYGSVRRRQVARAGAGGERNGELADLTAVLLRIEQELKALVAVERRELALQENGPASYASPDEAEPAAPLAAEDKDEDEPERRALTDLDDEELLRRVDRLDRALGASRTVLIRRYVAAERKLAHNGPVKPKVRTKAKTKTRSQVKTKPKPKPRERPAREEVRDVQRSLNAFAQHYLEGVGPLMVDGKKGPATNKRIRRVKYYLGYTGQAQRSAAISPEFLRRLRHPRSARASNPAMLRRALARRRKHRKAAAAAAATSAGVAAFDGRQVAAWLKPYLDWARANGWKGTVTSGWRSPEYSEQVCRSQCGAPSCPGTCAGRNSNHAGRVKPAGAVDVSDIPRFAELMRRCPHSPRIFNALGAADPEHFSASGR